TSITVTPNDAFNNILSNFSNFGTQNIIDLIKGLANLLKSSNIPLLNDKLPLINKSINDLLTIGDKFISAATDFSSAASAALKNLVAGVQNFFQGDGTTTDFALTFSPADASHLQVYLNGVLQSSGFSVMGSTLHFSSAPSTATLINAFP